MAADGGSVFFWGKPLTTFQKRMAGSFKMAADDGSVIYGGVTADHPQKGWRAHSRWRLMVGVCFFGVNR